VEDETTFQQALRSDVMHAVGQAIFRSVHNSGLKLSSTTIFLEDFPEK
jgi:hypothetical protein